MAKRRLIGVLMLFACSGLAVAQQEGDLAKDLANWPVSPFWAPPQSVALEKLKEQGVVEPMAIEAVPTPPLPLIGINPCRIVDTRGNGFTGAYGPPALAPGSPRNFTLTGQCGISASAQAVSLNITVTNTQGPGFILIYPQGGAQPNVSTLNYVAGQTVANAAIVPLGNGGGVTIIAGVSGTNLILDTNGYYPTGPVLPEGTFEGQTLRYDGAAWVPNSSVSSDGMNLTLSGVLSSFGGVINLPAIVKVRTNGSAFLHNSGVSNTFVGPDAGNFLLTGADNAGLGNGALFSETSGNFNTAAGFQALNSNTQGSGNTAVGYHALVGNTLGNSNTAVGNGALRLTTGGSNIALGSDAGLNLTSGGFNMYLGNEGVASESGTIRIGSGPVHSRLFVAGVLNSTVSGASVLISGTGQLGIPTSSARFKEDIEDMSEASSALLKLRPVTFRYKGHTDDPLQYGLIAEEVEKVLPELVFHDASGQPDAVLYHELPAMLLNELQKQQQRIERGNDEIERLRTLSSVAEKRLQQEDAEIASLRQQLQSLEERLLKISMK